TSVTPVTGVLPVYALAPVRFNLPDPDLVIPVAVVPLAIAPPIVSVAAPLVVIVRVVPAVVPREIAPVPRFKSLALVLPAVLKAKSPSNRTVGLADIVMAAPLVLFSVPPVIRSPANPPLPLLALVLMAAALFRFSVPPL